MEHEDSISKNRLTRFRLFENGDISYVFLCTESESGRKNCISG